jgi:hypothetical protein
MLSFKYCDVLAKFRNMHVMFFTNILLNDIGFISKKEFFTHNSLHLQIRSIILFLLSTLKCLSRWSYALHYNFPLEESLLQTKIHR